MLAWFRRGMSESAGGMSSALGAIDSVFNPGAARAREVLDVENQQVVPAPTPGDTLLAEGRIVIRLPPVPDEPPAGEPPVR
jgi:hypothetical protein